MAYDPAVGATASSGALAEVKEVVGAGCAMKPPAQRQGATGCFAPQRPFCTFATAKVSSGTPVS